MLVGNLSRLCCNPMKHYGARGVPYGDFHSPGLNGRRFMATQMMRAASKPAGYRHPRTWVQPRTSGGLSSHNNCSMSITATGTGAMCKGSLGTCSFSIVATAIGGLIVPGVGTCSFSINSSGDLTGWFTMAGSAAMEFSATADLNGYGSMSGTALMEVTADMISFGIGHMVGTTEDTTTLTPSSIASAVWQYTLEGSLTAADVERILLAINAGKTTIAGSTASFRDQADTKDRVVGEMTGSERTTVTLDPD